MRSAYTSGALTTELAARRAILDTSEHKGTPKSKLGVNIRVPKTRTRTVRLDQDLDDSIQKRAKQENITVNFLINSTIRKLVEWDIPMKKLGMVTSPEGLLNKLIEKHSDEACLELGRESVREDFIPAAEYLFGEFSPRTSILLFRLASHYAGWWEFDDVADVMDARKQILIFRHHRGHKWAKYYQGLIEGVYRSLGKPLKIECTDYVCVVQFDV